MYRRDRLENTATVLKTIINNNSSSVSDATRNCDLSKATCYNQLNYLKSFGILYKTKGVKKFKVKFNGKSVTRGTQTTPFEFNKKLITEANKFINNPTQQNLNNLIEKAEEVDG